MTRTQGTHPDSVGAHFKSADRKDELAGFSWQFVAVIAAIVLGIVVVVVKGLGLF